ncbi:Mce family protein [Gordonia hirsuta DSM 44140 = NBRC 16056]|uniref:Mce family protein n=1 Tax=Gordonia hirsuta DSM 44140 = NBRC 16056 TaxID=1121927 RepID=L7L431_9ACTN|nr:MCE family protein [Gordonia hirsuta]GAC55905.1 Mce family protein [Gordonia hirsuta DSM 44140 = NBRC 16056]
MKKALRSSWESRRYLWYGLIGSISIIVVLLAVVGFSELGIGKTNYTAKFTNAGGIRPGDKVRVAGIDKGEVTDTKLTGDRVTVSMRVDKDVKVTDDGLAVIKMSTMLGQRFVEVSVGDGEKPAPDGVIPNTEVPYDLQKTLEAGVPIIDEIDNAQLAASLKGLNTQLDGVPDIAATTLDALTQMSDVINNRTDQINQLIKDTRSVTNQVSDSQQQLSVIVGQGAQLAGKITAREALVTRLLDGLADLTAQAELLAEQNQNQFAPLMVNLNTISQGLEKNRDNLRAMLDILPVTARAMTNLMGDGPYANGYLPWGIFPDNWLCKARVVDGC